MYDELGESAEARTMYEEVVAGFTAQLGATHTSTLAAKMNLAILLKNLGESAEARTMYEEVVAGYTAQLGATHADTLGAKMNQAGLLAKLGESAEARTMLEEVVAGYTAQLGATHARTLKAKGNLAESMAIDAEQKGEHAEAAGLYRMAADAWEPEFGKDYVQVVHCRAKARELSA